MNMIIRFFIAAGIALPALATISFAAPDSASLSGKTAVTRPAPGVADEELILEEPVVQAEEVLKDTAASAPVTPSPATPEGVKTMTVKKDTARTIIDEDLILDGGAEDLLGHEKPAQEKKAEVKNAAAVTDSLSGTPDDTAAASARSDTSSGLQVKAPVEAPARVTETAVAVPQSTVAQKMNIEKVRSIDFGANLKEYRSPKLAMLMSLLLPGSGQVYVQSNLLAAGFLALEAAVFGTGYAFIAKGKKQKKTARSYADRYYDAGKLEGYCEDLRRYLNKTFSPEKANSIYLDSIFFGDSILEQGFLENARKKNDAYYDLLGENSIYVRGWEDVEPAFSANNGFEDIDTTFLYRRLQGDTVYLIGHKGENDRAFGFSKHQAHYMDLITQSQSSARIGRNFYMSLLVNHIASAVIAGIIAKKHNDALLGEQSFWQRIDIEQQQVNTGSHSVNGYALQVRF
ncbi:MAG: hypothetical protein JXA71_00280 [Chitinispirillaceae bacterium]|nr:hypothetical protein [Chitinispirillaceae bacterium]